MIRFLCLASLLVLPNLASATHVLAGEISYRTISVNPPTFEFTVNVYVDTDSQATIDSLIIDFGDGVQDTVPNLTDSMLWGDISRLSFLATHTYAGPGTFMVSVSISNRESGITNIPNSVNIPLDLEARVIINPFMGTNSTPTPINPPVDQVRVDSIYMSNPSYWVIDGDSLVYRLEPCLNVVGYQFPDQFPPGPTNTFSMTANGTITWDRAQQMGTYNFVVVVEEWRSGVKISETMRDIHLDVGNISLGQEDPVSGASISIFPNPVGKTINIESGENFSRVLVHDVSGKVVLNESFQITGHHRLFVQHLRPGYYIVKVYFGEDRVRNSVFVKH